MIFFYSKMINFTDKFDRKYKFKNSPEFFMKPYNFRKFLREKKKIFKNVSENSKKKYIRLLCILSIFCFLKFFRKVDTFRVNSKHFFVQYNSKGVYCQAPEWI